MKIYQREVIRIQNQRRTDSTMAKKKRTNNNLQNITHKTKDRVTRTPLKPEVNIFFCLTTPTQRPRKKNTSKCGDLILISLLLHKHYCNQVTLKLSNKKTVFIGYYALIGTFFCIQVQVQNCIHWTLCSDWTFLLYSSTKIVLKILWPQPQMFFLKHPIIKGNFCLHS